MKSVAFLLADGVGIRNYLYSDVLKELIAKGVEPILLHDLSDEAIEEIEKHHHYKFISHKIPQYKETVQQKFLRELISLARIKFNIKLTKNASLQNNWKPIKKKLFQKVFYFVLESISFLGFKKYASILRLEKWYENSFSDDAYGQLLKDLNVDVLFNTHQRVIKAVPIIASAKKNNIKTIGAIFSWDNIPKAKLTVRTDSYVVWSEHMKDEMKLFYPEIAQEKIIITGTPQFEFYANKELLQSKEEFCNQFALDASKKIICYSGDDTRTSPYDPDYLYDLASSIHQLPEDKQAQVLLRRCPVDLTGRFDSIVKKYPKIIKVADPLWNFDKNNKQNWTLVYPKFEDVALLINTVQHCDVVINVGSTMAHDFAMYQKPAIYINYDVPHAKNWSVDTIYKFQHFRSMGDLQPVFWLKNKETIIEILNSAFICNKNSKEIIDGQKWLETISNERENASSNITNLLLQ
ncbi:hypothetical protein [Polaribacter atrinae]|uniref:hypothetical protein n=1 Tax=Polaribacter atrinae TaxID=1333662 RepID=UPI002490746C|nr:hypothetical protein [Polaribacter atrinae]